jgi:hypothetical protein
LIGDAELNLDLNNDNIADFSFSRYWYEDAGGCHFDGYNTRFVDPLQSHSIVKGSYNYAAALELGETIDGNLNWEAASKTLNKCTWSSSTCYGVSWNGSCYGPWSSYGDKYLRFALHLADGGHYGWIRLQEGALIKDYACSAQPNTPLLAGDVVATIKSRNHYDGKVPQRTSFSAAKPFCTVKDFPGQEFCITTGLSF